MLRADMGAVDLLIGQMGKRSPSLAMRLREWAQNFEYEAILTVIAEGAEGAKMP